MFSDKASCIDINRCHGFRLIDDQMATGFQHDPFIQGFVNFILNTVQIKNRPFAGVMLQTFCQFRYIFVAKRYTLCISFSRIDANTLNLAAVQIPHHALHQWQITKYDGAGFAAVAAFANRAPGLFQVFNIVPQELLLNALSGGTQNITTTLLPPGLLNGRA